MLETAVAISITTFLVGELNDASCGYLNSLHLIYKVLRLHAIGSDVLHSTRTHFARDERQILRTIPSFLHAIRHNVVPSLARTATKHNIAVSLFCGFASLYGRMKHDAREVACEQKIAALAYDKERKTSFTHNASSSLRLFNVGELDKAMASCFDAEGVVSQEAMIKEVFHHHIKSFISFQCPPLRRNVSSVSRPLAMPRITKIF